MVCRALYEISLWRYFARTIYRDDMSRALRDIAVAIFARTIYRDDISRALRDIAVAIFR